MERVPALVPVVVGVKVTLIEQLAPAASEFPQLSVCAKSPLAVMLEMFNTTLPVLASVKLKGALVTPKV